MFDYYPESMQNIPVGTSAHMCQSASVESRSCLQVCVALTRDTSVTVLRLHLAWLLQQENQ